MNEWKRERERCRVKRSIDVDREERRSLVLAVYRLPVVLLLALGSYRDASVMVEMMRPLLEVAHPDGRSISPRSSQRNRMQRTRFLTDCLSIPPLASFFFVCPSFIQRSPNPIEAPGSWYSTDTFHAGIAKPDNLECAGARAVGNAILNRACRASRAKASKRVWTLLLVLTKTRAAAVAKRRILPLLLLLLLLLSSIYCRLFTCLFVCLFVLTRLKHIHPYATCLIDCRLKQAFRY
jgi:hypothetical protein